MGETQRVRIIHTAYAKSYHFLQGDLQEMVLFSKALLCILLSAASPGPSGQRSSMHMCGTRIDPTYSDQDQACACQPLLRWWI
jgi:hypothetical protein